jgi:hypothetical protein
MSEQKPLYNSRVTRIYFQYLRTNYPDIDIDSILKVAGIANYEIEDHAHWFTQEQQDRLHEILVEETGDPEIARKAGRFAALSEGMGAVKQYLLGLTSPTAIYLLMEKLYPLMSRGAQINAQKIGPDTIEIISIPKHDVEEKFYQCQNRMGTFEALATWFTNEFAKIEHPDCLHKGDDCCRYLITWEKTPSLIWKKIRNYFLLGSIGVVVVLFFLTPIKTWFFSCLMFALSQLIISFFAQFLENRELTNTIEIQKEAAEENLLESDIRYNNALLIQEIGQVAAKTLAINELIENVVSAMEKRLDFDRGMIMLADKERTRLIYKAGYGHDQVQKKFVREITFSIDKPESKGPFVLAMREGKPFLIDDIREFENIISQRSLDFARRMDSKSLICVPIIYETEALGILVVDNSKSKMPLKQSDLSLSRCHLKNSNRVKANIANWSKPPTVLSYGWTPRKTSHFSMNLPSGF